nr:hypothetical protein PanWU01x14_222310 [Ipomoea batatas]
MASSIKSTKLSPGCPKAKDPLLVHPDRIEEFRRRSNGTGPGGTLCAASISISIGLKRGVTECVVHDSSDLEMSTLLNFRVAEELGRGYNERSMPLADGAGDVLIIMAIRRPEDAVATLRNSDNLFDVAEIATIESIDLKLKRWKVTEEESDWSAGKYKAFGFSGTEDGVTAVRQEELCFNGSDLGERAVDVRSVESDRYCCHEKRSKAVGECMRNNRSVEIMESQAIITNTSFMVMRRVHKFLRRINRGERIIAIVEASVSSETCDSGGAVCAVESGAAVPAAGAGPRGGVWEYADQRAFHFGPHHYLLRPHHHLPHRHRSPHLHRLI